MYYLITFSLFTIFVLSLILYFIIQVNKHKNRSIDKFDEVLTRESIKGLSKSDVKSRKKRVKHLPLSWRFVYQLWLISIFLMMFFPIFAFALARAYLIETFFIPKNALWFELNSLSVLVFGIGSFFSGISILVAYSYITNRGIIRKADSFYQMGSFQEYPKGCNIILSAIFLIIGLPIMIIGFNSYRYCTDNYLAVKSALSINEVRYPYSDIDYIDKGSDNSSKYEVKMKNGKSFMLLDNWDLSSQKILEASDLDHILLRIISQYATNNL